MNKMQYISVKECAEMMGFSDKTVFRWISEKKMPFEFYKMKHTIRIKKADVDRYIKERTVKQIS